ncbi:hypothetical protein [Methylobacterium nodulans]|uniref:hypothetical protein n=1 Tax=Methylobacterium nodulans TaxID=114616 RepID=UPI001FCA56A3|nr:hypothetical protein [Methylobacterium nodulans]
MTDTLGHLVTVALADRFGPWANGISEPERTARLRCLRALTHLICGPRGWTLCDTLERAETDPDALVRSVDELGRLPALDRRKILSSFAHLHRRRR